MSLEMLYIPLSTEIRLLDPAYFFPEDTFAVRTKLDTTTGLFERLDHPLLLMLLCTIPMTLET